MLLSAISVIVYCCDISTLSFLKWLHFPSSGQVHTLHNAEQLRREPDVVNPILQTP